MKNAEPFGKNVPIKGKYLDYTKKIYSIFMEKFPNPGNPVSAAKEQKQMYSHRGRAHKQTERWQYILGNFSIADEYYSDCL